MHRPDVSYGIFTDYNEVKGETLLQFHGIGPYDITYVNGADDPRRKPGRE